MYQETEYDKKHGRPPLWWGKEIVHNAKSGLYYAFYSDTDPSLDPNTKCSLNVHESAEHLQSGLDEARHFNPSRGFEVTEIMKKQAGISTDSIDS